MLAILGIELLLLGVAHRVPIPVPNVFYCPVNL